MAVSDFYSTTFSTLPVLSELSLTTWLVKRYLTPIEHLFYRLHMMKRHWAPIAHEQISLFAAGLENLAH